MRSVGACKRHPFLDVPSMGGDADAGDTQKRTRRHLVNLQAVALLTHGAGDEAGERLVDGFLPVEPVGGRFHTSGHIVECPSQGRQFFLKTVRIEATLHRNPIVRVRLAAGAEGRRQERTLLDQYGSGCDQSNLLQGEWDADFDADDLARDHQFHAPVLLAAGGGVVGCNGLGLAEASGRYRTRLHTLLR